ncbi:MAG: DUF805 domain-containing protein [Nitratireductor sp.]
MRGEVLYFDDQRGIGFIDGDDGNRYHFASPDLVAAAAPGKGAKVEFLTEGNRARDVMAVGSRTENAAGPRDEPSTIAPTRPAGNKPRGRRSLFGLFLDCVTISYARLGARAPRREFWGFFLFVFIVMVVAIFAGLIADGVAGNLDREEPVLALGLTGILVLALALPSIAVTIRRLHDIGLSGWFILLGFVPTVGNLIILVFALIPSQKSENKWGPPPVG